MVFAFIPTMTKLAFEAFYTSVFVDTHWLVQVPVLTNFLRIHVNVRFSSEILPVVSKNTLVLFMILFGIRAPNCLVVETVKIWVLFELVDQINRNLCITVSKRTVLAILALICNLSLTELRPIFVGVIKLFNPRMAIHTSIALSTLLFFCNKAAKFRLIVSRWSSSIFSLFMVVGAFLQIVLRICILTKGGLEFI